MSHAPREETEWIPFEREPFRSKRSRRAGYTLMELVVTLPAMGVLTLCLGSAITIAVKSVPSKTTVSGTTLSAAKVLDLMASEIPFATSITTDVTAPDAVRQLTFVIPDRDGHAPAAETVTYSWSGMPGDPLQRSFNGTTVAVVADVQEFALAYDTRTQTVRTATTTNSGEIQFFARDGASAGTLNVTTTTWPGEFIQPSLAADATGWNVTRVDFVIKKDGTPSGTLNAQIRTSADRLPTNVVLAQQPIAESLLPSNYGFHTVTFNNVPMQSPRSGLYFVLPLAAGSPSPVGTISFCALGQLNLHYASTANTGTLWTASTGNSMRIAVYGTVDTTTYTDTIQYLLANVRCTLRVGGATASRLTTSFRVLNEPQVNGL